MRVRTRREGVDDAFAVAEPFCDITSAFVALHEKESMNSGAAASSVRYNVRINSRTALLLCRTLPLCAHTPGAVSTAGAASGKGNSTAATTPAQEEVCAALMGAEDEVDRYRTFVQLSHTLEGAFHCRGAFCDGDENDSNDPLNAKARDWSLLTPQESRELPARWVMQSLNDMAETHTHREALTLLDRGATVRLRHGSDGDGVAALHKVVDVADMAGGQYWVDIEPITTTTPSDGAAASAGRRRVEREEVALQPPQPLYVDALLPADEACSARGTSTCLFFAATLAVRRLRPTHAAAAAQVRRGLPRTIAVRMGHCAREARTQLHARHLSRRSGERDAVQGGVMEVQMTRDCVTLRYGGQTVEVLQRVLERLSLLWDARVRAEGEGGNGAEAQVLWRRVVAQQQEQQDQGLPQEVKTETAIAPSSSKEMDGLYVFTTREPFFLRVFTMLLRYRALLGDLGYNQGPHAAVPPLVLQHLHQAFDVQCEAFASPLNAQLPQFGSLFPDTDFYFGSLGAFFDLSLVAGHYEVNPPFVTALLQRLQTFLLHDALPRHDSEDAASMLFAIVLPSHDLDETEKSASAARRPQRDWGGHATGGSVKRKRGRCGDNDDDNNNVGGGGGTSTERALRESPYCLAHTLCAAAESAYIDGHQHVLRAPLFCIGSPTRLIVLGNHAARRRYGDDAAARLTAVRDTWCRYTLESAGRAKGQQQ